MEVGQSNMDHRDVVTVVTSKPKNRFLNFSTPHIVAATIVLTSSRFPFSIYLSSFVCGNGKKEEEERRHLFAQQSDDLPLPIAIYIRWREGDVAPAS